MTGIDAVTLGAAKSYVRQSLNGVGALKGAPCEIQNTIDSEGSHTIVFEWEDKLGTIHESQLTVHDGEDGEDGKSAYQIAVEHGYEGTEEEWVESHRIDEEQLDAVQNKLDSSLNTSAIANTTQSRQQISNNEYRYPQGMSAYIGNDGTGTLVFASITHDESITDPVQYLVYDANVKTNTITYVRQQKLDTGHTNSLSFIDESHLVVVDGTTFDVSILNFEENVLSIADTITIDIPTELESVITAIFAIKYKKDTNEFVALLQSNDSNKYYAILDRNFNIKRVFRTQKFTGSIYNSFGVDTNYIYQGLTTDNKSYVLVIDYNGNIVGKEPVFPDFDTEIEDIEVIPGYCVLAACYFTVNGHRNIVTFSKPNIGRTVYGDNSEVVETMTYEEIMNRLNGGGI